MWTIVLVPSLRVWLWKRYDQHLAGGERCGHRHNHRYINCQISCWVKVNLKKNHSVQDIAASDRSVRLPHWNYCSPDSGRPCGFIWCIRCAIKINDLDGGCGLMCSPSLHLDSTMYAMYEWMEIWSRSVHLKCTLFRQSPSPTNLYIDSLPHLKTEKALMTYYDDIVWLTATFHLIVLYIYLYDVIILLSLS